jgi:carbamate kinase
VSPSRDPRLLVVALGSRALQGGGRSGGREAWARALERCLAPLVDVAAAGFRIVLVHGTVPSEAALLRAGPRPVAALPLALDLRAAEVQGAAGYAVQQALDNTGRAQGREISAAVIVSRVEVAADDPAFARPTRPVGPSYTTAQARRLTREHGWTFLGKAAARRRVVPSPEPRRILEAEVIRRLADTRTIIVTAGGGGVPVIAIAEGYRGVDAMLQEDATAGVLATAIGADRLVFLTGVDRVEVGHRTDRAIGVEHLSCVEARALVKARAFPPGSIGPKIEAGVAFVEAGGREAIITSLLVVRAALDGRAGTRIVP